MEPKTRVYDVECLYNFFCVTFVDRDSDEKHHFRIWAGANDTMELCEFVWHQCAGLVGYNNLAYDWPILNYVLVARNKLARGNGEGAAFLIKEFSNRIINQKYSALRNPSVPQLDLFKMHHFDNKNKAVSLKALQIAMNWPLVADMPVDHTEFSLGDPWADRVEEYNTNDVLSTKHFLKLSERDLTLRKKMTELYGIDMLNFAESKMGESIMLHKVAEHMKVDVDMLRKVNTKRDSVNLGEVIVPIDFQSKEFNSAVKAFKNKTVDTRIREDTEEKKQKEEEDLYSCIFDGVRYDFGVGGLHGLRGPGVYQEDEQSMILSADVSSYYINLAIKNGFAPEHLKAAFGLSYEGMYKERKKYPKGSLEDKGLKIGLVAVTGKSFSQYSPLYDPKYFFSIMVNGQLQLAWLAEMITVQSSASIIMANTDGLEILVPRSERSRIDSICQNWELSTGLMLEYKQYKSLYVRDVNNYIGLQTDGKTYVKGAYEYQDLKWEKDHSMLCVPKAAEQYLVNQKPIMESLTESPVESFFIGKRAKSGGRFEIRHVYNEEDQTGEIMTENFSRTIRYLITNEGGYLFKKEENAINASRIDSPWRVKNMMDVRGIDLETLRPLINYKFYEAETKRLLDPILHTQINFL